MGVLGSGGGHSLSLRVAHMNVNAFLNKIGNFGGGVLRLGEQLVRKHAEAINRRRFDPKDNRTEGDRAAAMTAGEI